MRRRFALLAAVTLLLATLPPVAAASPGGRMTPDVSVNPHAQLVSAHDQAFFCEGHDLDLPTMPVCYRPEAMRKAYGIQQLLAKGDTGKGRTIVIVDAFDNPYVAQDLALFDARFGLPDPVFKVVYPFGRTPFDFSDPYMIEWSSEISLDVEWAHAIAPDAAITLVLARSPSDTDLIAAVKYAVDHNLGDVISQSFGESERCAAAKDVQKLHAVYAAAAAKGMTVVISSGDIGVLGTCDGMTFFKTPSVSWAASDPLVTGVGATNVQIDARTGGYVSERAWSDMFSGCYPADALGCSGGGYSVLYRKPAYQNGAVSASHGRRGVPDVAFGGGVDGGVLVHWGVGLAIEKGIDPASPDDFYVFGGTSAGAPQWAGLVALADQLAGHRLGAINPRLYAIAKSHRTYPLAFHDVTKGNNNFALFDANGSPVVYVKGYAAGKGWDPVTGLGSPKANVLVPLLASHARL